MLAERPVVLINVLIGSIGAIGQSVLLAKALVDYPFKILEYPPSEFFVWVGRFACLVSATSAIASVYVLRSTKAYLIAAIPVVLCPIYFWLVYNGFFFGGGYGYARAVDTESDLVATELMGYEFGYQAISLSGSGLIIGLAIGGITFLLLKRRAPR